MAKRKARRSKSATVQVRVEPGLKAELQRYARSNDMTPSALLRLTLKNLAEIVARQ